MLSFKNLCFNLQVKNLYFFNENKYILLLHLSTSHQAQEEMYKASEALIAKPQSPALPTSSHLYMSWALRPFVSQHTPEMTSHCCIYCLRVCSVTASWCDDWWRCILFYFISSSFTFWENREMITYDRNLSIQHATSICGGAGKPLRVMPREIALKFA